MLRALHTISRGSTRGLPAPLWGSSHALNAIPSRILVCSPTLRSYSTSLGQNVLGAQWPLNTVRDRFMKQLRETENARHFNDLDSIVDWANKHMDWDAIDANDTSGADRTAYSSLLELVESLLSSSRPQEVLSLLENGTRLYRATLHTKSVLDKDSLLAQAFELQSVLLAEIGSTSQAALIAADAVRIWKTLHQADPSAYTAPLSAALMNLGCRQQEVGEIEEAVETIGHSLSLARQQYASSPPLEQFVTIGEALVQLSLNQCLLRPEKALRSIQEAVRLARKAYGAVGLPFAPRFAETLAILVDQSIPLGDNEAALNAVAEQLRLIQQPGIKSSIRGYAGVTAGLIESSKALLHRGCFSEALQICNAIKGQMAPSSPQLLEVEANASFVRAASLSELDHLADAFEEIQRCAALCAQLTRPRFLLASAMNEHARILSNWGRIDEAFEACREAVDIQRAELSVHPDAEEVVNLARFLVQSSQFAHALGRSEASLKATEEAIDLCRQHLEIHEAHECLAAAFMIRLRAFHGLERHDKVVQVAEELHVILESFLEEEQNTSGTLFKLVECVTTMIPSLRALGREDDAKAAEVFLKRLTSTIEEAIDRPALKS